MNREVSKKIIVSVTNDLVTDQRVHKVCCSLQSFGIEVLLVGRVLPDSPELIGRSYSTKRFRLLFNRSILFYAEYNIRLFFFLLFNKADFLLSNDLDTLAANYLAAILRKRKLYYDSHEYYTEVPELVNRPFVKGVWEKIEGMIFPKLNHVYTVSPAVSEAYEKKYNVKPQVVRNFPVLNRNYSEEKDFFVNDGRKIIIYQGVVNVDRGLEEAVEAMKFIDNAIFYIIGRGDIIEELKVKVVEMSLQEKVIFPGVIPFEKLPAITRQADVGLSIEKAVGLNYTYALPNKLFDYIHAEVPVVVSPLKEIMKVMESYDIGAVIDKHDPVHIAEKINAILADTSGLQRMKVELNRAKNVFCWENEEQVLKQIFNA